MQKCICDICGVDEPQHNWKIKEKKLYHSGHNDPPLIMYKRMDICDKCFDNLVKLRYEQVLEERVTSFVLGRYEKLYPDDLDMQRAYLAGVQDVIDILLQNKIVKQR